MARKILIAGNWKMNKTGAEGAALVKDMKANCGGCCCNAANAVEVLVCPPFTSLSAVIAEAEGTPLKVGAQNIHWEESGAYTGEISGSMLKEVGVTHVIIGHSERRQYFGETDETVNKRLKAALKNGLVAIVCIGETLKERQLGVTEAIIERQVRIALSGITAEEMKNVVFAYEPVWAIGTGEVATNEQAQAVHAFVRALLRKLYDCPCVAENTRILYGGSMKPGNAAGLLAQPDIDGGLIGGAALKAEDFLAIIKAAL
ncbi:MAG: triose-phosphate isomerase [Victivallales bacterium]|nr:triose-phosphate isomerase [Victivallales bacterium]